MAFFLDIYADASIPGSSIAALRQPEAGNAALPPTCTTRLANLQVRAVGLGLVGVAILSIRLLTTLASAGYLNPATPLEFAITVAAVITLLLGNLLLWEGGKIKEPCEVSGRWRRHHRGASQTAPGNEYWDVPMNLPWKVDDLVSS